MPDFQLLIPRMRFQKPRRKREALLKHKGRQYFRFRPGRSAPQYSHFFIGLGSAFIGPPPLAPPAHHARQNQRRLELRVA